MEQKKAGLFLKELRNENNHKTYIHTQVQDVLEENRCRTKQCQTHCRTRKMARKTEKVRKFRNVH